MLPNDLDSLVSLGKARECFPVVNGSLPSPKTLTRWATKGCRGVTLQTETVGGRRCTRPSWVEAFLLALNPPKAGEDEAERRSRIIAARDPRKDAQVDRFLASRGYYGAKAKRAVAEGKSNAVVDAIIEESHEERVRDARQALSPENVPTG